jgi:hypothetical protein
MGAANMNQNKNNGDYYGDPGQVDMGNIRIGLT